MQTISSVNFEIEIDVLIIDIVRFLRCWDEMV